MNLPNSLTLSRIFFIPLLLAVMLSGDFELDLGYFFVTEEWLALAIFLCAAATDFLDGYLARTRRQVTTLGKLLDPIADKLLISAAFICLVELGRVPAWIVVLVIGREFAVSGLRYIALTEGITISASWLGKGKMTAQVVAISLFLVAPYDPIFGKLAQFSLAAVVVLTVASMIDYFRGFWGRVDSLSAARESRRPELMILEKKDKKREAS